MPRPIRLRLKPGVTAAAAIEALRGRATEAENLRGFAVGPRGFGDLKNRYLAWSEATEVSLRHLSYDPDLIDMLHTVRHWEINRLDADAERPVPMVQLEIERQLANLAGLIEDLETRRRWASGDGQIAVLDTNILLHFALPAAIKWVDVVDASHIRLVLPLRVVEELDEKKRSPRPHLAKAAQVVLRFLEERIGEKERGSLGQEVSIEVLIAPGPRMRPADADQEILDACLEIGQLAGTDPALITADLGMRLRARSLGLRVIEMPERYSRARQAADSRR